jgi:uroporphyrinogen-III decarboxylase
MIDIKVKYKKEYDNINKAYHHVPDHLPVIINNVNYWLDGVSSNEIPEDYFTNPASMVAYQLKKIENHKKQFNDDYIPFLMPWFGTIVVPSAFGCKIEFPFKRDPALTASIIKDPSEIKSIKKPDPYKDGLMPVVLKTIDYMKAHSDLRISVTDPQGPLNIAICLCGVENLFLWMYTNPDEVHHLMDFCTEVLIDWIKVQKKHAGQDLESGAWPHGIVLPEGFGGVWIADDDCTVISPELYKEFVVPYNSKVFKAFGGGTLHFCGSAEHQLENFLNTEGLKGINNFCMGNFNQIYKMQELYEDKLTIMVCDFVPLDIKEYYSELLKNLKRKGTILATFISSECAMDKGKYAIVSRDADVLAKETYKQLISL